jgi:hypothetical protein
MQYSPNIIQKLASIYLPQVGFSNWVTEFFANSELYDKYAATAVVYSDPVKIKEQPDLPKSLTNADHVSKLVILREPVNMGMRRYYDKEKLAALLAEFNIKSSGIGYYETYYNEHNTLAPNIAIYCKTPFVLDSTIQQSDALLKTKRYVDIHVLNSIGYAFDSKSQPDYKYFIGPDHKIKNPAELCNAYSLVFNKIFVCALDKKLETIIMPMIGLGAFSGNYSAELESIWLDALLASLALYSGTIASLDCVIKEISLMGIPNENHTFYKKFCAIINKILPTIKTKSYTYIPVIMQIKTATQLNKVLFVNAWDMFSFVGNGNYLDCSLDGNFGRRTALAVLCWPLTNKYLNN